MGSSALISILAPPYGLTSFSHRSFGACISTDITPPTQCRTPCLVPLILWTWLTARWSSHMMTFRWESPGRNKGKEGTRICLAFSFKEALRVPRAHICTATTISYINCSKRMGHHQQELEYSTQTLDVPSVRCRLQCSPPGVKYLH